MRPIACIHFVANVKTNGVNNYEVKVCHPHIRPTILKRKALLYIIYIPVNLVQERDRERLTDRLYFMSN